MREMYRGMADVRGRHLSSPGLTICASANSMFMFLPGCIGCIARSFGRSLRFVFRPGDTSEDRALIRGGCESAPHRMRRTRQYPSEPTHSSTVEGYS